MTAGTALAEADSRWQRLVAAVPSHEEALIHLASNRLQERDLSASKQLLRRLDSLRPLQRPARLHELDARYHECAGDTAGAEAGWKRYVEQGGDRAKAGIALARIALRNDDPDGVHRALDGYAVDSARSEPARLLRTRAYMRAADWSRACESIGELSGYEASREAAAELLARCYLADRRHDQLREVIDSGLTDALELHDYLVGRLRFVEGRLGEASGAFERSMLTRGHPDSKVWYVRTLAALDPLARIEGTVEEVLASDPEDHRTAARCWEAAGLLGRAAVAYRRAAELEGDSNAWSELASFHFHYRDWGRAWAAVFDAKRAGVVSERLDALERNIRAGLRAAGERPPRTRRGRARFEFRSSERLVDALVDRLERRAPPPSRRREPGARHTIALVINSLGPGGAERQVVNLANGLVERHPDDTIVLLCTHLSRTEQDTFYLGQVDPRVVVREYHRRESDVTAHDVPALAPFADLLEHVQPVTRCRKIVDLAKALDELDVDVVHGWLDETLINTVLAARMLGVETIAGRWAACRPASRGRSASEATTTSAISRAPTARSRGCRTWRWPRTPG